MKNSFIIPTVEESDGRITKSYDIYSRLLKDRIIILSNEINDDIANLIVAQLLFLDSEDNEKPIEFYINSPGGSITAGMAIYDAMRLIDAPVHCTCIGMAASMGAFLLSQGEPGFRTATLNSEIMIHQPLGGFKGQETDIQIHAKRIAKMKMKLVEMMASSTNDKTDPATMWELCERDNFLEPEEALEIGLIDKII